MNRYIIITSVVCLLLGALPVGGNAQLVFVDTGWPAVCVDSVTWVDVRVDSTVNTIHSYACLLYIDTSKVYLDSVIQGTILDSIFGGYDTVTVWFGWEYDEHHPDSLYFGASIFGAGTFVNGPGQLTRIWLTGKREGETPVAFGRCVLLDTSSQAEPMEVITEDEQIIVLGSGVRYGDVNDDGMIDISDVVYLINYLYKSGPEPKPWWFLGDASCDKVIDIADVVYLINYLFRFGPEPCYPCGKAGI